MPASAQIGLANDPVLVPEKNGRRQVVGMITCALRLAPSRSTREQAVVLRHPALSVHLSKVSRHGTETAAAEFSWTLIKSNILPRFMTTHSSRMPGARGERPWKSPRRMRAATRSRPIALMSATDGAGRQPVNFSLI